MVEVSVRRDRDGWLCKVSVDHDGERSEHTVRVARSDLGRWGRLEGEAGVRDLVDRSFAFLLEREPPSSILRTFDLAVIQRYFPDYDQQFRR